MGFSFGATNRPFPKSNCPLHIFKGTLDGGDDTLGIRTERMHIVRIGIVFGHSFLRIEDSFLPRKNMFGIAKTVVLTVRLLRHRHLCDVRFVDGPIAGQKSESRVSVAPVEGDVRKEGDGGQTAT